MNPNEISTSQCQTCQHKKGDTELWPRERPVEVRYMPDGTRRASRHIIRLGRMYVVCECPDRPSGGRDWNDISNIEVPELMVMGNADGI